MALLQNGSLFSAEPITMIGGSDYASNITPWCNTGGKFLNIYFGDSHFDAFLGFPPDIVAWIMPIEEGGLFTNIGVIIGIGSAVAPLIKGILISTTNMLGSGTMSYQSARDMIAAIIGGGNISLADLQDGKAWLEANINIGAIPSSTDNAYAILESLIDGPYTLQDVLKIIAAVNAGKISGGPDEPIFRNMTDISNVVSGTVDSDGNRTNVVLNP